jgi:hypothetical protein
LLRILGLRRGRVLLPCISCVKASCRGFVDRGGRPRLRLLFLDREIALNLAVNVCQDMKVFPRKFADLWEVKLTQGPLLIRVRSSQGALCAIGSR